MVFAIIIIIIILIFLSLTVFLNLPQFGKLPSQVELSKITSSPNYRNGKFQNIHFTPDLKEGVSMFTVMRKFFFGRSKRSRPSGIIPSQKTNLHLLDPHKNCLVWFGHSSYFIKADGKNILVDPVLSGHASPVNFTTKSYAGTDVYSVDDIPEIDYFFISHDHWDHLDYETVLKLKPKIKKIITGLGVAAHLQRWGFAKYDIIERDWNQEIQLGNNFIVHTISARHFSGRGLKRNKSIWSSFALRTPTMNIFVGGDSGYDTHFKEAGNEFGPFDLAILECGQYNEFWKYIHMMPEETVQAALDLKAKILLPVHWGKFSLGLHAWDEPITRVTKEAELRNQRIIHPMIGEEIDLKKFRPPENGGRKLKQGQRNLLFYYSLGYPVI